MPSISIVMTTDKYGTEVTAVKLCRFMEILSANTIVRLEIAKMLNISYNLTDTFRESDRGTKWKKLLLIKALT